MLGFVIGFVVCAAIDIAAFVLLRRKFRAVADLLIARMGG